MRTVTMPADPSNYHKGRLRSIRLGVVHGTVTPAGPPNAAGVGRFFAHGGHQSSAHVTVDGGGTAIRSIADGDTAFAAPNANADGLHLELCMQPTHDKVAGTRFFASAAGQATLTDGAAVMGAWAAKYHLPVRWLTPTEIRAGQKGLCDHATISAAYNPRGHWDVGAGFPVQLWLDMVTAAAEARSIPPQPKPTPLPHPQGAPAFPGVLSIGAHGKAVTTLQQRLASRGWRVTVNGAYGPGTAGIVAKFQADKRLKPDGVVGVYTWRALWALPIT